MHDAALLHELNASRQLSDVLCNFFLRDKTCLWLSRLDRRDGLYACSYLLLLATETFCLLLTDVVIELHTGAVLHQEVDILLVFEKVVHFANVLAFKLSVDFYFLSDTSC